MELMYHLLKRANRPLSKEDKQIAKTILDEIDPILGTTPGDFRLVTGQKATGATGRIALNAYFLLLGRKIYGQRYERMDKRLAYWKMHLGYWIMNGYFTGRTNKGIYCCSTCTLSVLPLYGVNVFHEWDCKELADNVISAIEEGQRPFDINYN